MIQQTHQITNNTVFLFNNIQKVNVSYYVYRMIHYSNHYNPDNDLVFNSYYN